MPSLHRRPRQVKAAGRQILNKICLHQPWLSMRRRLRESILKVSRFLPAAFTCLGPQCNEGIVKASWRHLRFLPAAFLLPQSALKFIPGTAGESRFWRVLPIRGRIFAATSSCFSGHEVDPSRRQNRSNPRGQKLAPHWLVRETPRDCTSPLHPSYPSCWFHASHESAHNAEISSRFSLPMRLSNADCFGCMDYGTLNIFHPSWSLLYFNFRHQELSGGKAVNRSQVHSKFESVRISEFLLNLRDWFKFSVVPCASAIHPLGLRTKDKARRNGKCEVWNRMYYQSQKNWSLYFSSNHRNNP